MRESAEDIVIVGAGETGARAAAALRENGWAGTVTLVGHEPRAPYERPPLSKAVMVAAEAPQPPYILSAERLRENDITLLTGCAVTRIDREAHAVELADGRRLGYGKLLLATGCSARRLTVPGADPGRLHYLRTYDDALALREQLRPDRHVAIVGGGFIGLELAASARSRGCGVTLIEAGPRLLMRGVPADIAAAVAARHQAAGVTLKPGVGIERVEPAGTRQVLVLSDGSRVECDGIVVGIGAAPNTELAAHSGLAIDNGVAVDARLATDDPDIFAAGDCCSFPHPLYDGRRIRLEAWRNAQDQGALAARNLLGAGEDYTAVPWFWSDQYELTLQIAGLPDAGVHTVARPLGDGVQLNFHLAADGRLVAASSIGPNAKIAKEIRVAEMLIARRAQPDANALAAPEVKLKSLL